MTLRLKIELIVGALLMLGALFGAKVWLDEHDSRLRAEMTVQAQKEAQQEYLSQIADLGKKMADRDAAYQQQLDSLGEKYKQAVTPQQIALLVGQVMGLKQPVTLVTPPATTSNPNPTPVAQIAASDAPQVKAYVQQCEECKLERLNFQADAADRQAQASLAQLQIDSLKKENLSLQQAVKGGSFFQRLGKATKYLVVGAAAGVVAICATGHCK